MVLNSTKKGIAFSILALFLSFLIFAFAALYMYDEDYARLAQFKETRTSFVNNEISYFKNSYMPNLMKFSLYNAIDVIVENETLLRSVNGNHSKLNSYIKEAVLNGTINGTIRPEMTGKTFTYFLNGFESDFNRNVKGNFSYEIIDINVFEKNTYYLSFQILANISAFAKIYSDQNVTWDSVHQTVVSIPIFDLRDPEFTLHALPGRNDFKVRPFEIYGASNNWNIDLFNDTIANVLSAVYVEPNYKYPIGSSFLNRMLNVEEISSYRQTLSAISFDHDEDVGHVFDSTLISPFFKHYGNTRLLMNFNNGTVSGTSVDDLSAYENSGNTIGTVDCFVYGRTDFGCDFDGSSIIEVSRDDLNLNNTNQVSISAWINPTWHHDILNPNNVSEIFRYGSGTGEVIDLRIKNFKLQMEIGDHNGGNFYQFNSTENIILNKWSHIVGVFNGDTGIGRLYVDGKLVNPGQFGSFQNATPIINFVQSTPNVGIGDQSGPLNEHFRGKIDEIAVYSKALSPEEISYLYGENKAKFIDYKDSLYVKGIEFDGIDDYVSLDNASNENPIFDNIIHQRTIEVWFKPYDVSRTTPQIIYEEGGTVNGFNIFLNNSRLYVGAFSATNSFDGTWLNSLITSNNWHYVVLSYDNVTTGQFEFYLNGHLINNATAPTNITLHPGEDALGAMIGDTRMFNVSYYSSNFSNKPAFAFEGIIDEVKVYNRTLSEQEITQNYFNYAGRAKGCCNYITLINPNLMGYNDTSYRKFYSYSSKLFFDNVSRNMPLYDITLIEVTNITSYNTNENYYNFLLDACLMKAYSITGFPSNITYSPYYNVTSGFDNLTCENLIKAGIY